MCFVEAVFLVDFFLSIFCFLEPFLSSVSESIAMTVLAAKGVLSFLRFLAGSVAFVESEIAVAVGAGVAVLVSALVSVFLGFWVPGAKKEWTDLLSIDLPVCIVEEALFNASSFFLQASSWRQASPKSRNFAVVQTSQAHICCVCVASFSAFSGLMTPEVEVEAVCVCIDIGVSMR